MTKKLGGRDARQDPPSEVPDESATNFRVDRVFLPGQGSPARPPISPSTASLMSSARTRRATTTTTSPEGDGELALRRQLSRLQRQLADAQRELANKDDELAAQVEKRGAAEADHSAVLEELQLHKAHLDELLAYRARTTGVEQRLQETIAAADELAHVLELERGKLAVAASRADELQMAFDDARSRWTAERLKLDEQHAAELAQVDVQKRAALDELRAAHERSLAALRGELEPKALAARSLAEERERLTSELAATKAEAARVATERDNAHQRDLAAAAERHASEQAALAQRHAAELARVAGERDDGAQAIEQAARSAELREQYWETTVGSVRDAQKKLQRELAEAKERIAALETDNAQLEERLAAATATHVQLAAATATHVQLADDKHALEVRLEATETEARQSTLDRARFVAYLEEGLALLGALPPDKPEPEPEPES